jgi:hypothetical protein
VNPLPKGQKYNQEYFVKDTLPYFRNEKMRLARRKTAINFSGHMENSMCHNAHRVIDELRRLKFFRTSYLPYSPDISPCDF